jgi:hypothetical chaperone protein
MKPIACGIDFGTSNTAAALAGGGFATPALVALEGNQATIPSTLFFSTASGAVHFGRQAIAAYTAGEEGRFMRSLKRILGTSLMTESTQIGNKRVKFTDILSPFIQAIKTKAEQQCGQEITSVVAGRPVHFIDHNPDADQDAENQLGDIFRSVGFRDVLFQYEPIAAAFAHEAALDDREHLAIVIDIGGGTSDFTIIRLSRQHIAKQDRTDDILANAGVRIGGNDFDYALSMKSFMPHLGLGSHWTAKNLEVPTAPFAMLSEWSRIHFIYGPKYKRDLQTLAQEAHDPAKIDRLLRVVEEELGHKLMDRIEDTKILLSSKTKTTTDLSFIETGLEASSSRAIFESCLDRNIAALEAAIALCCQRAGVQTAAIDLVILTGGGTSIPKVQKIIKTTFPNAALSEGNRLSSVGLGLAYDAERRYGL